MDRRSVVAKLALGIAIFVAGAAAGAGLSWAAFFDRVPDSDGWSEFHPDWLRGPATVEWGGRNVTVPEDTWFATDGATYFYAAKANGPRDTIADETCRSEHPPAGMDVAVLVSSSGCVWARHPGVSCSATRLCDDVSGTIGPSGPPP